jgi:hypothetical protein
MGKFCLIIYSCLCLFSQHNRNSFDNHHGSYRNSSFCHVGSYGYKGGGGCGGQGWVSFFMSLSFYFFFLRIFVCSLLSMPGMAPICIILVCIDTAVHNGIMPGMALIHIILVHMDTTVHN